MNLEEVDTPLKPTEDPIHKKEIEEKIEILFVYERFYFYKAKQHKELNDGETHEIEEEYEIQRLINDCI